MTHNTLDLTDAIRVVKRIAAQNSNEDDVYNINDLMPYEVEALLTLVAYIERQGAEKYA